MNSEDKSEINNQRLNFKNLILKTKCTRLQRQLDVCVACKSEDKL